MLQTYVFVPRLEKEAKVAKLNSQKRLTIKRRPQIFHIQSEEKKKKSMKYFCLQPWISE